MRYARGDHAWGECQRSGRRMLRKDMVREERTGLLVDPAWADEPHPQERPYRLGPEAIAIYRPAPELSKPPGEGTPAPPLESFIPPK